MFLLSFDGLVGHTPPAGFQSGQVDEQVVSLIDMTPTTLWCAGLARPLGMHGRIFLGDSGGQERRYAFSARDRIDETVNRVRKCSWYSLPLYSELFSRPTFCVIK